MLPLRNLVGDIDRGGRMTAELDAMGIEMARRRAMREARSEARDG